MSHNIKVLHITLTSSIGGGSEHIHQLLKNASCDIENHIATPYDKPYFERFFEKTHGRVTALPHRKFSLKALLRTYKYIKNNNIKIVHSHGKGSGIYGRILSLMTNTVSIHTFHGIHLNYSGLKLKAYLQLEKYLSKITHKFICVSDSEKELALNLQITTGNKIEIVNNGVEIPSHCSQKKHAKKFTILHISRFDFAKNSELVPVIAHELKKLNIIEDCRIRVFGDGPQRKECEALSRKLHVDPYIMFEGICPSSRPPLRGEDQPSSSRADCYLSTSRWEGLSLAILEAMAEGVPAIASRVTGNINAVEHNTNGFLFDINNPKEAALHIQKLYNDKSLWTRLSENSFHIATNKYDVVQMTKQIESIYRESAKPRT